MAKSVRHLFLCLLLWFVSLSIAACGGAEVKQKSDSLSGADNNVSSDHLSKQALAQEKVKLFIGQDLNSIRHYAKSGQFPQPSGVTTYLSFYNLLSSNSPAYGGLGLDSRGYPTNKSVDWGAGPLNALALAKEYPKAILNIGLNIAEGNQSISWAEGGLAAISQGKYNREINKLANFFKSISNLVYLRIGYEFDGVWNKGYENTHNYINAYQHIVDKLREKQVRNVAFVWQGSASPIDDILESKHEDIAAWYPGDNYVDWVGLSWFVAADKSIKGKYTQRQLATELVEFARLKKKPAIIAEASPQGYDLTAMTQSNISPVWDGVAGDNVRPVTAAKIWQQWYTPFFKFIRDNREVIKAVSYINADWNSQDLWDVPFSNGYWGDSRVQMNPEFSKLWSREVSDRAFWLVQ